MAVKHACFDKCSLAEWLSAHSMWMAEQSGCFGKQKIIDLKIQSHIKNVMEVALKKSQTFQP